MRFILPATALAVAVSLAATAGAQTITSYYATISDDDRRNSNGARLTDPGAILQQDRANFHRFGRADIDDEGDPFFGNRNLRARIPQLYANGRRDGWSDGVLTGNFDVQVLVFVCGRGSQPTHINVDPADGDDAPPTALRTMPRACRGRP